MNVIIRQFEEERKQWDAERNQLEEEGKQLAMDKSIQVEEIAALAEEINRLRSIPSVQKEDDQEDTLMAAIRTDLEKERQRSKEFEHRAVTLSDALDQTKRAAMLGSELDVTKAILNGDLDHTLRVQPVCSFPDGSQARSLEDENLWLRIELNREKAKIIELKKAAHSRREEWKEQLEEVTRELKEKQRLEEELAELRQVQSRDRKGLERTLGLEALAKSQVEKVQKDWQEDRERAQRELDEAKRDAQLELEEAKRHAQLELDELKAHFGQQLEPAHAELREVVRRAAAAEANLQAQVRTTMEITEQVQTTTQLLDLFLGHAQSPLNSIQSKCSELASRGEAGDEAMKWSVPAVHDANAGDLQGNLVKIVSLLRFVAGVLDARDARKSEAKTSQDYSSYVAPVRIASSLWTN